MKHASSLLVLTPLLLLAACGGMETNASLDENLKNPLFASRYYQDMTEQMVSLVLKEDPMLKDAGKKSVVDNTRAEGTRLAQEAIDLKNKGLYGSIMSDPDLALGSVLILNNTLYMGPDFYTSPGPSLHVYLSTVVDPRQARFPDDSAIDLGSIKTAYGAQSFALPETKAPVTYRSLVLWDKALGTIYGFAQLSGN